MSIQQHHQRLTHTVMINAVIRNLRSKDETSVTVGSLAASVSEFRDGSYLNCIPWSAVETLTPQGQTCQTIVRSSDVLSQSTYKRVFATAIIPGAAHRFEDPLPIA